MKLEVSLQALPGLKDNEKYLHIGSLPFSWLWSEKMQQDKRSVLPHPADSVKNTIHLCLSLSALVKPTKCIFKDRFRFDQVGKKLIIST